MPTELFTPPSQARAMAGTAVALAGALAAVLAVCALAASVLAPVPAGHAANTGACPVTDRITLSTPFPAPAP